jgi:hypothetical protein
MVMEKGLIADSSQKTPGPYLRRRRVDKVWTIEAPAVPRHTTGVARRERAPLKPKPDVKTQRAGKLQEQIKRWESKLKRAQTALKKLRPKLKRYEKLGVIA